MKDFRLALRQTDQIARLSRLAIVTLGLGVGANTAMFSVINPIEALRAE
jgi:hypothetical protein